MNFAELIIIFYHEAMNWPDAIFASVLAVSSAALIKYTLYLLFGRLDATSDGE